MKTVLAAAGTLLLLAPPASAQQGAAKNDNVVRETSSDCRVRIATSPSSWMLRGYDPFGGSPSEAVYSITYTNDGTGQCQVTPVFQLVQPPFGLRSGAGAPVSYAIVDITNAQDVTPRAGRSQINPNRRSLVLAAKASETISYRFGISRDDVKTDGTFSQNIELEALSAQGVAYGGAPLLVGVEVVPSARIGLAGAYQVNNGQALVDLGEMREGPAKIPLNLSVSSTGSYSLSISSQNAGRLRLADTEWYVPYRMGLGGTSLDLTGGIRTMAGPQGAGYRRDTLPIIFFIGSVAQLRAGTYRDTVTISVAAN